MGKITAITIFILVSLLTQGLNAAKLPGSAGIASAAPFAYEQYVDSQYGFSYSYPQGWQLGRQGATLTGSVTVYANPALSENEPGFETFILSSTYAWDGTLGDLVASYQADYLMMPEGTWKAGQGVTIDGKAGQEWQAAYGEPGATFEASGVVVVASGRAYALSVTGATEDFAANRDLYKGVVDSLHISP